MAFDIVSQSYEKVLANRTLSRNARKRLSYALSVCLHVCIRWIALP